MSEGTTAVAVVETNVDEKKAALRRQIEEELSYVPEDLRKEVFVYAKSGLLGDSKDVAKSIYTAAAKIGVGKSIGLNAQAALRGVIFQPNGSPTFTANTMAYLIKTSGKYDYDFEFAHDDKGVLTSCKITFWKKRDSQWLPAGVSEFTKKDAETAGLATKETFKKFPKNMFFCRAMTNGAKWACPDIFGGHTPYTPDEIPGSSTVIDYETLEPVEVIVHTKKPAAAAKASPLVEQLMRETLTDEHVVLTMFNVRSLADLDDDQAAKVVDFLEKKKRATPGAAEAAVAA